MPTIDGINYTYKNHIIHITANTTHDTKLALIDDPHLINVCRTLENTPYNFILPTIFKACLNNIHEGSWRLFFTIIEARIQLDKHNGNTYDLIGFLNNNPALVDFIRNLDGHTAPHVPNYILPHQGFTEQSITQALNRIISNPENLIYWDTRNTIRNDPYFSLACEHMLANMVTLEPTQKCTLLTPIIGDVNTLPLENLTVFNRTPNNNIPLGLGDIPRALKDFLYTQEQELQENQYPILDHDVYGAHQEILEAAHHHTELKHTVTTQLQRYHRTHQTFYTFFLLAALKEQDTPAKTIYTRILNTFTKENNSTDFNIEHWGLEDAILMLLTTCTTLTSPNTINIDENEAYACLNLINNIARHYTDPSLIDLTQYICLNAITNLETTTPPWTELVNLPVAAAGSILNITPTILHNH